MLRPYLVLSDHLGSTSTTANQDGSFSSTIQYTAFGEIRVTKNTTLTKYRYTGQLAQAELGLDYYVARFYDPVIGHFTQADTIVAKLGNTKDWDRYGYVRNNPILYSDPTGHESFCELVPKGESRTLCEKKGLSKQIYEKYGVTMENKGNDDKVTYKEWDVSNLALVYQRLQKMNLYLGGNLKKTIEGARFMLANYVMTDENCKSHLCTYSGWTAGKNITFYTTGSQSINEMNFYHENGHMLNSLPGHDNVFSNSLSKLDNPSFINGSDTNGYVNTKALIRQVGVIQASSGDVTEQWGDVFANYMADNIDLSKSTGEGKNMYDFVTGALGQGISN